MVDTRPETWFTGYMSTTTWNWNGEDGEAREDGILRYTAIIDLEDGGVFFFSRHGFQVGDAPAATITEAKQAANEWLRAVR